MRGKIICKECTPDKCCCCVDLEVGVNAIAGMNISTGFCVGFTVASGFGEVWSMKWCFIILSISSILSGVSLLHGTIKRNKVTTAGHLGLSLLNIVMCVIIAANFFSGYDEENWNQFWGGHGYVWIMQGIIWLITAFLIIYLGICVFRFLMEMVADASVEEEDISTTNFETAGEAEPETVAELEEEKLKEEGGDAAADDDAGGDDDDPKKRPVEDDVVLSSMSRRSSMLVDRSNKEMSIAGSHQFTKEMGNRRSSHQFKYITINV